ncbi:228_t:CDS:2 [Dentiscutata heterogama]|uniref:228_t:CDS:1 n=1 Tax=Dentiscutata heterogama TaxID=1316150 RepID=A0ACA9L997_9GLOM|nr:228_t:CDS:2 [Dentiscutata heterogama]
MAGNNRNQGLIQISDSNNENNLLVTESNSAQQSRQRSENNVRKSICWKYFEPFKVPKRGEITKCTIDGCNTEYTWCGSTFNLVRHLRTKHDITSTTVIQSSLTNNNSRNFVNLPVIKFIVSSVLPFNIVDNLKSSGLVNQQITSSIIEKQTYKVYDFLFSQLKSKIQQAKFGMLSFSTLYDDTIDECIVIIAYVWLTEDFKFRKILLHVDYFNFMENTLDDIINASAKWKLTRLEFINGNPEDFDLFNSVDDDDYLYSDMSEDIIKCVNGGNGNYLIRYSLKRWVEENNTQEISNIVTAIMNATDNLCSIVEFLKDNRTQKIMNDSQSAKEIRCSCNYHKIKFLKLIEQPLKILVNDHSNSKDNFIRENVKKLKSLLLDKLPFSIFPELLRLFKPLEHINVVTMRNIRDMLVNASNILNESLAITSQYYWERVTLESFLTFLINSYLNLHQRVGLFLDPHSKSIFIHDPAVKRLVLDECQNYYSESVINLNKSIQDSAHEEFEYYISRSQLFYNENDDLCEWWQKSKNTYPGLATLAMKYLPLLKLDDEDVPFENVFKFFDAYQSIKIVDKMAFLHYNMKNFDL